jgi:hypothetical protein
LHPVSAPGQIPTNLEASQTGVPDDADDLRGYHFKRLLKRPLTQILVGAFALLAGVGVAVAIGPALGGAVFVVALLLGVAIVFGLADKAAADDFFEVYAQTRGLSLVHGRGRLPQATPLLRKGDDRYTERTLSGPLGEGLDGTLALYTYEEESRDSDGDKQTNYYRYTVGLVDVPDCANFVPELYCQRKFGLRALEKFEDVFRTSKQRVELESEALDKKYEIFAGKEQDANRLRQLFAPTFIVWLCESAPEKFAFELVDGALCCYVSGHKEDAAELDGIAAATGAVAKRLRDEALE